MTTNEAKNESAKRWMEKAFDALDNASGTVQSHPAGSINRSYYACFYAASAVLILDGRHFVKHAGVRSALHQHLVHTGRIPVEIGEAYNALMETRQEADYTESVSWTPQKAQNALEAATRIVSAMKALLPPNL